jgi:hypothetical protein
VFYLLGGIGFVALAVTLLLSNPRPGTDSVLGIGGTLLAGLLLIVAYVGLRRNRGR